MDIRKLFGANVRFYRIAAGLSQEAVAVLNTVIAKEQRKAPATEPAAGRGRRRDPAAPPQGIVHVTAFAKRLSEFAKLEVCRWKEHQDQWRRAEAEARTSDHAWRRRRRGGGREATTRGNRKAGCGQGMLATWTIANVCTRIV